MKIGFAGVGKLGAPLALVAARHHDVLGYDPMPAAKEILRTRRYPHRELKAQEYLDTTTLRIADTIDEVVAHAEVLFVVIQTPHAPLYEGVTRLPETRVDFDYSFLKAGVSEIARATAAQRKRLVVAVMSTVLPGTVERELKPLLNEYTTLVYCPAFPAMGQAIPDFEEPEFVLLGVEDREAADKVREYYAAITSAPVVEMSIASAEACKCFYNSFITGKITLANAWMEICERTGANVDDVTRALSMATDRVVSPKYMRGGLGDAGGCHPRDGIALSWLSRELGMSYDVFGMLMEIREKQTQWLADLCDERAHATGFPVVVLGKAYKAETNLTVGSCATLLVNILGERSRSDQRADSPLHVIQWDPHVDVEVPREVGAPAVFIVATDHREFYEMDFSPGSVVLDPWGKMADRPEVEVVRIGRG